MKRELMSVLIGAALLLPAGVEAQRGRNRDRDNHRDRPAAVTVSGRLGGCVAPSGARAFDCRAQVVYSYGTRRAYLPRNAYVPRGGGHLWVRADWGPVRVAVGRPVVFHDRFVSHGELKRLLGKHAVDRLRDEGRRAGLRGALRGEWIGAGADGLVLVVTMEGVEIAELVDFDRDGLIDEIFLVRHHGRRVVGSW